MCDHFRPKLMHLPVTSPVFSYSQAGISKSAGLKVRQYGLPSQVGTLSLAQVAAMAQMKLPKPGVS